MKSKEILKLETKYILQLYLLSTKFDNNYFCTVLDPETGEKFTMTKALLEVWYQDAVKCHDDGVKIQSWANKMRIANAVSLYEKIKTDYETLTDYNGL